MQDKRGFVYCRGENGNTPNSLLLIQGVETTLVNETPNNIAPVLRNMCNLGNIKLFDL